MWIGLRRHQYQLAESIGVDVISQGPKQNKSKKKNTAENKVC